MRYLNHFHDPLSGEGLHDGLASGQSAMVWSQNGPLQNSEVEGDQSWPTLRSRYYQALTALTDTYRQATYAQLFKGLGHQMHLVQDMAVPAHVRNDAHAADSMWQYNRQQWNDYPQYPLYFESWAKKNDLMITGLAADSSKIRFPIIDYSTPNADNGTLLPISQIWDANVYNGSNPSTDLSQGLAEYTNANFFSDDTVFAEALEPCDPHYFPYPKASSTTIDEMANLIPVSFVSDVGKIGYKLYLDKNRDGESINRFVRVGYFYYKIFNSIPGILDYRRTLYLDEDCHAAYAEKLIPRAVGYSSALLDYFFRGRMQVQALPYFQDNSLFAVKLTITNTTATQEEMTQGIFSLVLRYRPEGAKDDGSEDIFIPSDETVPIDSLANNESTEIIFFTDGPIPIDRWDTVQGTLGFTGTLGSETGAVIGRVFTPGRIAFNEEWDHGLTGNHPWQSSPDDQNAANGTSSKSVANGKLLMETVRSVDCATARVNDLWVEFDEQGSTGLEIGPNTYVQFNIDEMSTEPADPSGASHVLMLEFNGGLMLQYTDDGPFLPWNSTTAYLRFNPDILISDNIHALFTTAGIAMPNPLYLTDISLLQQVYETPGQFQLRMVVDAIRIVDQSEE